MYVCLHVCDEDEHDYAKIAVAVVAFYKISKYKYYQ